MGEKLRGPEAFEFRHNPERASSLKNPELKQEETCDVVFGIVTYTTEDNIFPFRATGSLRCETCPVNGSLYGKGDTEAEAYQMALDGARQIFQNGCYKWIIKTQLDGLDRSTPMPDTFLPTDLQPKTTS